MDQKSSVMSKNMLLKFLPKAVLALTIQRPTFTPINGNKALKPRPGRVISDHDGVNIPAEARLRIKNPSNLSSKEPTSPKISCMGQIKHRRKISKEKRLPMPKELLVNKTGKSSSILNVFRFGKRKSKCDDDQMKRFANSRDLFANFDWTVQIAPVGSDGEVEDTNHLSTKMLMSRGMDLRPRQEINLWKRRTIAQPQRLKLNTLVL